MADYTLPDLPYDFGALEPHYSGEILELHHDKHHAAYVAGANTTLEKLADARDKGEFGAIVGLREDPGLQRLGPCPPLDLLEEPVARRRDKPDGALGSAIDEHFGSFDGFKAQLTQATTTIQGSGWGVLAWEPLGGA